jgi:RNA polymerase sigma-70 factor (ECF subfamily)
MADGATRITACLSRWSGGDREAFDALVPRLEQELRKVARRCLRAERHDHTLQATALVNEAWIRLQAERAMAWSDRGHFLSVAAQVMRFILVDYARGRRAPKRGGDRHRVTLSEAMAVADASFVGLLDVDAALIRLEHIDPRKARVATLRLFTGASFEEITAALGVSEATVMRDWRFARAWLQRELSRVTADLPEPQPGPSSPFGA